MDHLDLGLGLPQLAEISFQEVSSDSILDKTVEIPKPNFKKSTPRQPIPFKNIKKEAKKATAELIENETAATRFLSLCSVSNIFSTNKYRLMRYIALRAANLTSMGHQAQIACTRDDPDTDCERNLLCYMIQLQPPSNEFYAEIG